MRWHLAIMVCMAMYMVMASKVVHISVRLLQLFLPAGPWPGRAPRGVAHPGRTRRGPYVVVLYLATFLLYFYYFENPLPVWAIDNSHICRYTVGNRQQPLLICTISLAMTIHRATCTMMAICHFMNKFPCETAYGHHGMYGPVHGHGQ